MRHALDTHDRILELRALRPQLIVYECDEYEEAKFKILDKIDTPFWFARFDSELFAREAWEIWWNMMKGVRDR